MRKATKKKYLKALNQSLREEAGKEFGATFVFHPLGAKPKDATGVTASGEADAAMLEVMDRVQARVSAAFDKPSASA